MNENPSTTEGRHAENDQSGGDHLHLVTFDVAGEAFAVDIAAVQEITRVMALTRATHSPPEVEGVIKLREKLIPVLDLRKRLGLDTRERTEHNRIMVIEVHDRVIGFIVDRMHAVLRIPANIIQPTPQTDCSINSEFIAGVGELDGKPLFLLNLSRLFDTGTIDKTQANGVAA